MQISKEMHSHMIKMKSNVVNAIRNQMNKIGSVECYYNKITGGSGACEAVSTAFVLNGTKELSYLSQTDQLLMEFDVVQYNLDSVWTVGRSYRNEPRAGDGRHLNEFALLEFEASNMDLNHLIKFQQELLNAAIEVSIDSPLIPKDHRDRLKQYLKHPAKVITYTEVIKKLSSGFSVKWGVDFNSEMEQAICLMFDGPVMVTHYPESIKFFNMFRTDRSSLKKDMSIEEYNENRFTVDCVDFLLPFCGECFGGSRREEVYDTIKTKLLESRMFSQMCQVRADYMNQGVITEEIKAESWKPFDGYIEIFNPKKISPKTNLMRSGFGLGMGRIVQFLTGSDSVVVF